MKQEEYDNMPVKFPVEPCCTSAVHISCHNCSKQEENKEDDRERYHNRFQDWM